MMKKTILIFCLIIIHLTVFSQTSQELVSTSGDHFTNANAQLSWSIGEVVTSTIINGNNVLTQGFHQTNLTVTNVEDLKLDLIVTIFPNPTTEVLNLKIDDYENLRYQLYDLGGKLIKEENLTQSATNISVADFAKGMYLLSLIDSATNKLKTYQIIKQ